MTHSVQKAVIPVAGLGKRLWPATKILPKELLPIGTKPSLYFILEELTQSGLKEAVLITAPEKKSYLEHLPDIFPSLQFHFVEQKEPLGLGHAVGLSEKIVAGESFLVLLPDDIVDHTKTASTQLLEIFQKTKKSVSAAKKIQKKEAPSYGIYDVANAQGKCRRVQGVVEKPHPDEAPSNLAIFGRYLFTSNIFKHLQNTSKGRNGEIQLADAMHTLAKTDQLDALELEGKLFDIGNPEGLARANLYFGIKEHGDSIHQGIISSPR